MRFSRSKGWLRVGLVALFVASFFPVGPALAGPVIFWDVSAVVEFDPAETTFVGVGGATTNTKSELAWGIPAAPNVKQSKLVITGSPALGMVMTGGPVVFGPSISHHNFVQVLGSTELDNAQIEATFSITPSAPPDNPPPYGVVAPFDSVVGPIFLEFDVNFNETPNLTGTGLPCLGGGNEGDGINSAGCADIFTITAGAFSAKIPFPDPDGGVRFYILDLALPLELLPPAACAAVGLGPGCRGVRTAENAISSVSPGIRIREMQMPEPGTLALIGLGLVGLAAAGRIRRR